MSLGLTIMTSVSMNIVVYEQCPFMTNVVMNSVVMSNVFMTCDVMNKTVAPLYYVAIVQS